MLDALTLLVACQLVGEIIARWVGLPIPGPVVGLVLLLAGLVVRGRKVPAGLQGAAHGLLGNLGLLFVPAGVGVITQLDVLAANWLAVGVSILVSTFLGLIVTGWVMQRLSAPEQEGER
jgi:putative effector of murein hydrolase LrgA (UPF0299 family)